MVMKLIGKKVAQKITAQKITAHLDKLESSMFGGKLEKAELRVFEDQGLSKKASIGSDGVIRFWINPASIKTSKEAVQTNDAQNQATTEKKYSHTEPVCLTLDEVWFDTYDSRESVRTKYINDLEKLLDYVPQTHHLPVVVFNWGSFSMTAAKPSIWKFYVSKLDVEYTLFMPDATPVRAKVKLGLEQTRPAGEEAKDLDKRSPDHAKLYTVKNGDTLQGIATAEYEDPTEWRRIALANNIDDPLALSPGMKLLVPPILK